MNNNLDDYDPDNDDYPYAYEIERHCRSHIYDPMGEYNLYGEYDLYSDQDFTATFDVIKGIVSIIIFGVVRMPIDWVLSKIEKMLRRNTNHE